MKRETLDRAKELEEKIGEYEVLSYIMSYPYKKFKLLQKKPYVQIAGRTTTTEVIITDSELTKLIENYCKEKVKKLKQELEEL